MRSSAIGVGIIGANAETGGWAATAHIPALRALQEYRLVTVSTSRRESAEAASRKFGVPAFDNHSQLIAHPEVDLVVVTVKVPLHERLVADALEAGKMVYCEWPLATNLVEARRMYERAAKAGVPTVCGLQSRFSPVIRYARDLITEGYIGEVLATTLVGSGHLWGSETLLQYAYAFDASNGATTLTVPVAHALDALTFVLGNIENLTASMAIRRREVRVVEDGSNRAVTAPDHIAITGVLCGGAIASVFYRGGASRGENLRWEINGTKGDLVLTADIGIIQVADLKLEGAQIGDKSLREIPIPPAHKPLAASLPQGRPTNIAYLYAQFAKDLREGTRLAPDFADGSRCHTLVDAVRLASLSGVRQTPNA
ncbi:MAG TPA: Gfo/Idh/MocA family oxidoreductase [Bryobacteraceae bacterium]|jgi:predicted dehydrogenase|nr:Gfo/Idh/MocA family oxidoreductase [Bryobacteraceae bacterium]